MAVATELNIIEDDAKMVSKGTTFIKCFSKSNNMFEKAKFGGGGGVQNHNVMPTFFP
jgi:hypothetical protein